MIEAWTTLGEDQAILGVAAEAALPEAAVAQARWALLEVVAAVMGAMVEVAAVMAAAVAAVEAVGAVMVGADIAELALASVGRHLDLYSE